MRRGPALLVLLLTAVPATAQPPPVETIRLTLRPAGAPVPSLKYQLLPELRDRTAGNAAVLYFRAFTPEWQSQRRPEINAKISQWSENPRQAPGPGLAWLAHAAFLGEI